MSALHRFCGIDTGDVCALAVREREEGRPVRWIYFEAPPIDRLLSRVERHLLNLRKKPRVRASGETALAYERNENHFGFACAYARLAESLARSEGMLAPLAGGTAPPETSGRRMLGRK